MRIDGLVPSHLHNTHKSRAGKKSNSSFDISRGQEAIDSGHNPYPAPSMIFLEDIMSLQGDCQQQQAFPMERTVERGEALLAVLDRLHQDLLAGSLSFEDLKAVQEKLQITPRNGQDPKLNTIIGEIELRLAVELAKINRAKGSNGLAFLP